jgi:FlaA1/EpsC-like NDP-sugar epimerase
MMSDYAVTASDRRGGWASARMAVWTRTYLRRARAADAVVALLSSTMALQIRFNGHITHEYEALSLAFPVLWLAVLLLSGSYDVRYVGTGSDEFRKVLNAGVSLTAGLAILSYAVNTELSRTYLVITMPGVTLLTLVRGT